MRVSLTLTKVPSQERDRFRALSNPGSYREIRKGDVGERVAYSVEMTEAEFRQAQRDAENPNVNLIAAEKLVRRYPHLTSADVPGGPALEYLGAQGYRDSGLTGSGVDVGVLDQGLSTTLRDGIFAGRIKASKGVNESLATVDPWGTAFDGHGSKIAGLAVPPGSRLVLGAFSSTDEQVANLLYWMVDTAGVHIINMSFGSVDASTVERDACDHARAQGVLLFASAGNEGSSAIHSPAAYDSVHAISGYMSTTDKKATNSNYGNDIWAASLWGPLKWILANGSLVEEPDDGGTSAASALATRLAAMAMTKISPGNVESYLASHARRTGASPIYEGNGVLNLGALQNAIRSEKPQKKNLAGQSVDAQGNPVDENGNLISDPATKGTPPLKDGCAA